MDQKSITQDRNDLLLWYHENKRQLPWRKSREAYKIWISEVMLQQTTVAAVVPYYDRFLKRFPTVQTLAHASLPEIYEVWAGLGYYSRARNLHKAALVIANDFNGSFPKSAKELLQLPGFGPYTSRAVASLAFNEPVGVLDGNVIRILSRRFGLNINWWNTKERIVLQEISDQLAKTDQNADLNQALMELGATVCTPKKPLCLLCPWKKRCVALKNNLITQLPKAKPKIEKQIWYWQMDVHLEKNKIYLEPATAVPFLKNQWFPVGTAQQLKSKPKDFDLTHSVTKYAIYVSTNSKPIQSKRDHGPSRGQSHGQSKGQWIEIEKVRQINPTSLMTKILSSVEKKVRIKK